MGKYEPLGQFLRKQSRDHLPMTFDEIETVLGASLPPSKQHRAWWSNNPSNNVMTREWLDAGYETEAVDVEKGRLVFRKSKLDIPVEGNADAETRHPMFGCMKGMITFIGDYDPAEPSGEDWGDGYLGEDIV